MGVRDRYNSKKKVNKDESEIKTSAGVRDRFEKKKTISSIGFDTLESDLNTTGSTLFNLFDGWQTAETMNNAKAAVESMYGRIGAYQDYRTKPGNEKLPDLSELLGTYKSAIEGWDKQTELYGHYKNADAFNVAKKNVQLQEQFKGLTFDDVQKMLPEYEPDSDEYKFLSSYTGYTNVEDFDKGLEISKTVEGYKSEIKGLENRKKTYEGRSRGMSYGGFDKKIKEKEAELNEYLASVGYSDIGEYEKKSEYYDNLSEAKNLYLLENGHTDKYKHNFENADFAEGSKYIPKDFGSDNIMDFSEKELIYEFINNEDSRKLMIAMSGMAGQNNPYSDSGYDQLKENEKQMFNYLYHLDEQNGTKEAQKYLKDMKVALQKRASKAREGRQKELLENPFAATAFSLVSPVANLAGGMGNLIASAGEMISGEEYNPYSSLREISNANTHGRQVVGSNIAEATEGFELFGQNIPSFLYQTGESVLDSWLGGRAIGAANTLIMGTNAYQQKAKELTEAGEDKSTVQGLALVSGALEAAFEYAGFDHLMKLKDSDSIGKVLYNAFASQGVTEGLEELGTSVGTMIADISFRGKDSEYMKMHSDLLARGYSEKEANVEVAKAIASELGWSYIGGHLSGTSLGGYQSVSQYTGNVETGKDIRNAEQMGNVFDMASISPEASQAYEAYTRYANKGVNAEKATNAQIGNLYNTLSSEAKGNYTSAFVDMDKSRSDIAKQKGIRESETSSEAQKNRATTKLDKAISKYSDAQTRMGKYGETVTKLSEIENTVAESKRKSEIKAKTEKLSSGVETSVMADSGNEVEIKGVRFDKKDITILTNEGEVAFKDVKLSDRDAELLVYARTKAEENADEASLFVNQYDGKVDIDEYANDFDRVVYYANHSQFTPEYILEHKGSLSTDQVTAIYENTVIAEARKREAEHNKLIAITANNTAYTGYIDDHVVSELDSKLNKRQKASVEFLKVFATKAGMNLVFTPYSETSNGSFDIKDNTIYVSVYAGILHGTDKLKDTIIPSASHEITHWMEEKAPELWEKLKNVALDALVVAEGKSQEDIIAVEVERLDKKHPGKKHTEKDAVKELVARACEDMLAMSKEGRKMFDSMTEAEQKTFIDKVKEIISNLKEWIDELLSSYGTQSKEAELLRNYKDKLEEMSQIWDQMLVRSIEVNQALEKADVFEHLENGISKDGTTIVGKNNLQMSDKTYREGGREFLVNWLKSQKDLTEVDKQNIIEQTDRVAELMRVIDEGGELPDYSKWANMEVVKDENGEKVLSVIVKNGDYAMNIDFSQVCKKRVALDAVLNAMVQQGVLDVVNLSETDMAELNALIKEHDFEIACALCFVDAKRYRVNAWAESFCEGSDEKKNGKTMHKYGFNEMVRSLIPEGSKLNVDDFNFTHRDIKNQPTKNLLSNAKDSELDFSLIDKIMTENDSRSAQYRYAKAIKENPEIRKILNSSEIISSIGLDTIRLVSPKLYGLINGHQGTAKPKFAHSMVAYGNDVLKASNFTAEAAKMVGGVRCQSFSDFMASMVVDYAQFISELAAKKLTSHSYTKEPLFVKLFGLTGMKINMSLVPKAVDMTPEQQKQFAILKDKNANKRSKEYKEALAEYEKLSENAGLDENGNYIWEDESFPYDIAMDIVVDRRYSKNCGTIAVGISHNHIKKLLADERISMVIPYHKSGLNHEVAMMRDIALYKDYTDVQNTRDRRTGKKLDGVPDFDFYGDLYGKDGKEGTHDPKQTAQNYLAWCDENNYIPKFDEFAFNPNYYKLLIDFRVYDVDGTYAEQQPVQAIYPSNEEFNDLILNGVKDKDGKVYGGLKQQQSTSDRLDAESQQIIEEFKQRMRKKHNTDRLMQWSDKEGNIKKAEELSETDLRDLLDKVQYGGFEDSSYIPMRATTPEFFIDVVHEHSEGKLNVMHVPLAAQVEHLRQNLEEEEGLSYGEHRPHNLSPDDIVTISKEMGHPAYIVLQKNGRYAMVVSFYNKANKKVVVSIDFASDKDEIKNFKHKQYMNGYNEGYYNIIVTQYEPDDFTKYLKDTEIVYDKKKMNGRYQVGSGRVVTFTHDTPFIDDIVSHSKGEINEGIVNNDDMQHSDKDSEGNTLTEEQRHYFADSKVRDENGNLRVVYHGTPSGSFTVFRLSDGTHSSLMAAYGAGYYFDSVEASAKRYTKPVNKTYAATNPKVYKVYLNIRNPLTIADGVTTISKEQLAQIISRGNYQWFFTDGMPFALRNKLGKSKEEIQKLPREEAINHWSEMIVKRAYSDADILSEMVKAYKGDSILSAMKDVLGYDGAVYKDKYGEVWVAWDSNQIKSFDNTNPTSNPDIQYSDKDTTSVYDTMGESERLRKENEMLKADVERLNERLALEKQLTHGNVFNENQLGAVAGHLRNIANSTYDKVTLMRRIRDVYSYIAHSPNVYWEELYDKCYHIAYDMLRESKPNVVVNQEYKRILKEIRETKISLDSTQAAEANYRFGSHYNRAFFGKVIISNEGIDLDSKWQDWAERYPEFFKADVNSADQLGELYDIIDSLKEASETIEEYDMEETTRWLATEIYNQYWNVSTIKTTADKYDKKIKRLNFEHRQAMKELRDEYNSRLEKRLATQRKEDKERYTNLVNKIRQRKDAEVTHARELGKKKMAEYKDRAERKTRIQRITANALDLNDMLVKNSKDKHVPEAMKGAVTELLQAIDFSSKRLLKGGDPTKKDISLAKALTHLKYAIKDGSQEIGDILDEMYGSGIDDLTKELVESADKYMSEIDGETFTLNEMSLDELKKLDTIVKIIKRTVNKVNQFHVAQYNAGVQALGVRSTSEIDSRKKIFKDNNKHFQKLNTHLYWNNLNPYYAFKNLGEASQKIFTALEDGQDKLAFLSKEVIDFAESVYSAKDYKKWSDTYFDFSIPQPNGKVAKFSLNVPQLMSLYAVTKQEDARRHILHGDENGEGGGITIVETSKKEAVRTNIRLTEANLKTILDTLNDKSKVGNAKEVADKLQEFMGRRGAELGNEISMARWGIKSFGIENYFPIKVSEGSVPIKNDAPGVNSTSMLELLNMSFTHARNNFAKQSVEIGDMLDVFANHMSNMVRYNAMALPILDYYKWMNSRGRDDFGTEYSVQTSVKNTFGDHAWSYLNTLLKDVSGGTKKSTRDKLMIRFFKNAKVAKVAGNLRVALLQFTSFVRAGAVMDNKYLLKAVAHKPKSKMAKEKCGIALWKSMGYYDTDITRGLSDQIKHNDTVRGKIIEWSLKGAEKADEITWGYLWNACELEIRDKRKDLAVGSEEFYKAIALRLRNVIYQTQVVDSMLTRNQMMRSPDGWDKVLTTFGSENSLSFNLAMDAFVSYELDKRSMGKKAAKEKNKKYMRKVMTAFVVTNAVTATLQTLFDGFRDYDEEEKDEEYWAKLMLTNFFSNSSVIGKTPYGNLVMSALQGFTPSRMDTDWMNSAIKTGKELYKLFNGEGSSEKAIKNALKLLSDTSGIAAYNVYRDIYAFYELFND